MHDGNCSICKAPLANTRYHVLGLSEPVCCCVRCIGNYGDQWCIQETGRGLRLRTPDYQQPPGRDSFDLLYLLNDVTRRLPSLSVQHGVPFIEASKSELERDSKILMSSLDKGCPDVIVFGDVHNQFAPIRDLLLYSLDELRSRGFTHLGVEMLPSDEAIVSNFVRGKCDKRSCFQELTRGREDSHRRSFAGSFLELLEKAHTLEFRILYLNSEDYRDRTMAMLVKEVLEREGGGKVACLLGSAHGVKRKPPLPPKDNEWQSMAEILGNQFKIVSIYQTAKPTADRTFDEVDRPVLQASAEVEERSLRHFEVRDLKAFGTLPPIELTLKTTGYDFIYLCPSYDRL